MNVTGTDRESEPVREREEFFEWLDATAEQNAAANSGLSDAEVLAVIDAARAEANSA
jgi:hypothetical protein